MQNKQDNLYTEGQFVEFIESCFGDVARTGTGDTTNYTCICPVCRESKGKEYTKKKLAIKLVGDAHLVKCWVCGYKSKNLLYLIKKYRPAFLENYLRKFLTAKNLSHTDEKNILPKEDEFCLPSGFTLLATCLSSDASNSFRIKPYLSYLRMRYPDEFSDTMLWKWKFGIALKDEFYRNRIIMPSFDASGNLNYYTSRAIDGRMFPKYLNPNVAREDVVFNELDIDWQKPLVIVEGPFDLVKCPKNSTCLLGSELTEEYRLFQKVVVHQTPVILSLDSDETGRRKTEIIANMLYEYGVTVRIVSYPKNIKDPGDLSIKEFIDLTNEAKLYSKVYSIKNKIANLL